MNQEGLSVKKLTEEQSWLQTGALLVLAFIAFSFGISYARAVLVPFTLALFLNYLVAPIVDFQMIRLKLSKFVSVTLTLLLVVLVLVLMTLLALSVIQNVTEVTNNRIFMAKVQQALERPVNWVFGVLEQVGIVEDDTPDLPATPELPTTEDPATGKPVITKEDALNENSLVLNPSIPPEQDPSPSLTDSADDETSSEGDAAELLPTDADAEAGEEATSEKSEDKTGLVVGTKSQKDRFRQVITLVLRQFDLAVASWAGVTLLNILSSTVLTSIFVGFMLAGRDPYKISKGIYAEIDQNVRKYISTKFFISAVTGVLVWILLSMMGLQFASMFGLFAFFLNFIPSIGSIIATFLPLPIALVQFGDSPMMVTAAILLPGSVQMIMGNVIEPKIMGDGLQLHPATILLALAFFGMLWGPVGMLLAAPITASVRIVLMRFKTTEPIGRLMAGILPEEEEHIHHL
ncbi:AI-2E family transporter [Bremerella cremea]|uniref:AI-2E family transporter n=1 Tax=Bremerella cremea TaxID=1031537 RepID=A0A368KY22_9BACT|nr:AI-2E family transporter [Bremerella cremea]RCS54384.1 AI-2E family transporter [Bremerella cremea]